MDGVGVSSHSAISLCLIWRSTASSEVAISSGRKSMTCVPAGGCAIELMPSSGTASIIPASPAAQRPRSRQLLPDRSTDVWPRRDHDRARHGVTRATSRRRRSQLPRTYASQLRNGVKPRRRPAYRLRTQHRPPTSFAEPAPRSASATLHERHALLDSGADRRGRQPLPWG